MTTKHEVALARFPFPVGYAMHILGKLARPPALWAARLCVRMRRVRDARFRVTRGTV